MNLQIRHQDSYSRGELLLRTFFGWLYIAIPHVFCLFFLGIGAAILSFIAWWAILFTGKYPKGMFDFQLKIMRWSMRLNASLYNLVDGYPAFGLNTDKDNVKLEVEYPETLSRGILILRLLFGIIYYGIPHGFCLLFRAIWGQILMFIAWWVVLFTGKYPENWHKFNVGTLRWISRINLYSNFMTDKYPPFSGLE